MRVPLRIGTRGSALALAQAALVREALRRAAPELATEIVPIRTQGDRVLDRPLAEVGGKGLFIREIEEALQEGRIDLAVHSLKDLPTELPGALVLGAVLERGDPRDALVSRGGLTLAQMSPGSRVGTSSLRRRAQLLAACGGRVEVVDIRGNLDTRVRKMREGQCEALVLAASGLARAGLEEPIAELLDPEVMLPAVCQGIIGVETRRDEPEVAELMRRVDHPPTHRAALAERAFLRRIEGGCLVPAACLAVEEAQGCTVTGLAASLDGRTVLRRSARGAVPEMEALAVGVAEGILAEGGTEILEAIRGGGRAR